MKFTKATKKNIADLLILEWIKVFNKENGDQAIELLNSIWDLHAIGSTDSRFADAYDDIIQHFFRNNDWETEYLFETILKIYNEDTDFKKFIDILLRPENYESADYLIGLSSQIDAELNRDKLRLVVEEYTDLGFPVQKVYEVDDVDDLPVGVQKNKLLFYVIKDNRTLAREGEYLTLTPIKGWNDSSVVSRFKLRHYRDGEFTPFGETRIIHEEENITWENLPDSFYQLPEYFCSLSSKRDFYFGLQRDFGDNGMISLLFALRDVAYFPDIYDRFHRTSNFNASLLRADSAERIVREIRADLSGRNLENLYSFGYNFKPAYSKTSVGISLDFSNAGELPSRIFAVIGKNGTGKTQLMTNLPNSFAKNSTDDFQGELPSFSKIIAVSYSVFDSYKIPRKNATFNYVYCGLKDDDGEMRSSRGLVLSFHKNWKKIEDMGRTGKWRSIIGNFLEKDVIDGFILPKANKPKEFQVSLEGYNGVKNKLSSGQSILLYIITQVVANIRLDSLILYDEPETHLHPNAIVELMNTIYSLVEEFESYCLIATHSPIVIRELFSKNVYVMERIENTPLIRRIGIESFGENLGILTDEVFGDREMNKQYKSIIKELVRKRKSYEQIIALMEFDEVPLSLNARVYIKNLMKQNG